MDLYDIYSGDKFSRLEDRDINSNIGVDEDFKEPEEFNILSNENNLLQYTNLKNNNSNLQLIEECENSTIINSEELLVSKLESLKNYKIESDLKNVNIKEIGNDEEFILNDFDIVESLINRNEKNLLNEFYFLDEEKDSLGLVNLDDEQRELLKHEDPEPPRVPTPEIKLLAEKNELKAEFAFPANDNLNKQTSNPEELIEEMKEFPFFEQIELDPHSIYCKICLHKSSDYQQLSCNHKFCLDCYKMFCQSLVESCKILPDEVKCPDCEELLNDKLFMRYFSVDEIKRIHDLRYKIKGQALVAQKKALACPVSDCPGYAHLLQYEKITACCKCKCSLCTVCGLSAHPSMTCEENLKESPNDEFQKLIFSQNWKKCPTCGVPVEKIGGCQFLYCSSTICKGRNYLCNLCGRFVIMAQHYSHYKSKGPYSNTCNTLDGIPENIDPSRLVPNLGDFEEDDSEELDEEED